tara:strand:+ start:339 stop:734 length:396 start_codon:yes stop_codon:yes gene_type:complete
MKKLFNQKLIIILNIIFLFYYSFQLLIFTDEFAINNFGFFNHAIAGLFEILGILILSLCIGLIFILIKNYKNQLPIFIIILIFEVLVALNLWRYLLTNSPGETDLETIKFNALIFTIISIITLPILINRDK